jgi:hypothetical protein
VRLSVLAAIAATTVFACSPSSSGTPNASPTPSGAANVLPGGCGSTQILKGGSPQWVHKLAGTSTYVDTVPYVLAAPPTVAGFLYGYPLRAGHPTDRNNKILWLVNLGPRAGALNITAHLIGATAPAVSTGAGFIPSGDAPSIIDMPEPGCWEFELSWSGRQATVDITYQ